VWVRLDADAWSNLKADLHDALPLIFGDVKRILTARRNVMERIINIHMERLPEGFYLATSNEVQGLIAQGRTVIETMEIARDVARRLLEAQQERQHSASEPEISDSFDLPLVVGF
jgi:predicted RNase H-like HicB family nuclease